MKQHLAKLHDKDPVLGPEATAELNQLPGLRVSAKCGPGQTEQQQDILHHWNAQPSPTGWVIPGLHCPLVSRSLGTLERSQVTLPLSSWGDA